MNTSLAQVTAIRQAMPFIDLLNVFLEDLQGNRRHLKGTTQEGYITALKHFAGWIAQRGTDKPTADDITAYRDALEAEISPRTGKALAKTTQARYLRAVGMLFKWAETRALYPNITDGVRGPKIRQDNSHRDALTSEDAKRILDSIDRTTETGKRDYAMFLLCLTGGLRIIELQRADICDLKTIAGRKVLAVWGKGRDEKDALINIEAPAEAAIMDYLATRPGARSGDPLFTGTSNRAKDERITEPGISRIFKTRLRAAGYDSNRITAHSLRHTAITLHIKSGGTAQEAQRFARHASINTTMIYAHNVEMTKDHSGLRIYNMIYGTGQPTPAEEFAALSPEQQQAALAFIRQLKAA